jgi:hypothetical protein
MFRAGPFRHRSARAPWRGALGWRRYRGLARAWQLLQRAALGRSGRSA